MTTVEARHRPHCLIVREVVWKTSLSNGISVMITIPAIAHTKERNSFTFDSVSRRKTLMSGYLRFSATAICATANTVSAIVCAMAETAAVELARPEPDEPQDAATYHETMNIILAEVSREIMKQKRGGRR